MAFRTNNTASVAAVAALSQEQRDRLAAQAIERQPLLKIDLWPNRNQREGKRDADFTGRGRMSTVQLAEKLAAALANGEESVEVWIDMWHNEPSVGKSGGERPILSGRARNFVEPRESATGDAQSESIVNRLRESLQQG